MRVRFRVRVRVRIRGHGAAYGEDEAVDPEDVLEEG